jgi:hypothetical protein
VTWRPRARIASFAVRKRPTFQISHLISAIAQRELRCFRAIPVKSDPFSSLLTISHNLSGIFNQKKIDKISNRFKKSPKIHRFLSIQPSSQEVVIATVTIKTASNDIQKVCTYSVNFTPPQNQNRQKVTESLSILRANDYDAVQNSLKTQDECLD